MAIHALGKTKVSSTPPIDVPRPPPSKAAVTPDDGVEAKQAQLGGAHRAPTGTVELPILGGRPRVESFEAQWKQLESTFRVAKPETLEAMIGTLGGLGFSVTKAKDDHVRLRRGDFELRLDAERLGAQPALRIELDGPQRRGGDEIDRTAVLMGGALLPKKLFGRMKDKLDDVLADFHDALRERGNKPLPTTFDQLKAFIDGGKTEKARAKDVALDTEVQLQLDALTTKLESLQRQGLAPKSIVVYTDGPDGAGKSSTGAIVLQAISKAGYTTDAVSFKAPTAEEREQHWLERFRERGVPQGEMSARFWDRGPAGDAVYGTKTAAQAQAMAKDVRALERELAGEGVLLFKVHIFADQQKQAETFGKRFARQAAADEIEGLLAKRGKLTDISKDALDNIRGKVDGDDLRALVGFDEFQARFLRFSKAAGYHVVDASDRHAARLTIIDALSRDLDAFAARA